MAWSTFSNIALITALISKSWAIPYNSAAKILCVTCLYLMEDQWMMLALNAESAKHIIKPIYENKFLLLAKEDMVKIIR